MAALPPVWLGAIIFGAFAAAALVRKPLEARYVVGTSAAGRPKRQFTLDLCLCLAAGCLAVGFNTTVLEFPLTSGISLLFGCLVVGFFVALDMAIARERQIILNAMDNNESLPLPERLFPVTRKFSLVAVSTVLFITLIIVLVIARDVVWLARIEQTESALLEAQLSITYEIFFITAVLLAKTINLIVSYSINLRLLFRNETAVLDRVTRGDLSKFVTVATNDEFGLIADRTNTMIRGLQHRIELISALKIAEEVQQNLLPRTPPRISGLDISGVSVYCQETGGDYFDYLELPGERLGIVVADAADHGIGSALHMTTARALLLLGAAHFKSPASLLSEINYYLARDSIDTGRFVSAFFMEIDPGKRTLRWVRAGHEPAHLYDPAEDRFDILAGDGMVLGAEAETRYRDYERNSWAPGSVILIGTDGLHETCNAAGDMFGRGRLQEIVRGVHMESAENIRDSILTSIENFRGDAPQQDDATLVVAKLLT